MSAPAPSGSTVASSCCGGCSAVISTGEVEGGLGAAMAELHAIKGAAGWSCDDRGRVRCPTCLGQVAPMIATLPPRRPLQQFSLLGDV